MSGRVQSHTHLSCHNYSAPRVLAWTWLLHSRTDSRLSHIASRDGRRGRTVACSRVTRAGVYDALGYYAHDVQHSAGAYNGADNKQAQLASNSSRGPTASTALPDPLLFSSIKSCSSWLDCQRLLTANAEQLDAMLLSTLITQTVYVYQIHPQQQHATTSSQDLPGTNAVDAHQQAQLQAHQALSAGTIVRGTRRSSRSGSASSKVAFQHYLEQMAQVSMLLIRSFRPQQFSNVLWGLVKCGYKPSAVFVDRYLAQAELQLVRFPPRNLAQLIWALATMRAKPSRSFLASFLAESGDRLAQFKPQDIANTLWALATLGVQPPADWLQNALSAAERQWVRFRPQELSITIWGFAKLGLGFKPQPASPGFSIGGGGLSPEGMGSLLVAVVGMMPAMSPQEVCNVLWGLAVGQADVAPQQVQVLAVNSLRVLYNRQLTNSGSSAGDSSRDLCVCIWALTKLQWAPSLQESQLLLHLLQLQLQQQQWDSGYSSPSGSCRSAATLLWCLGKLRIRPPAQFIQRLLLRVQQGLASPTATAADAVQALAGCRVLQWRPSKTWWEGFYRESLGVLQEASNEELARVLSYAAAMVPLQPTGHWWEAFWHQVGMSTDTKISAYGLKRKQDLAASAVQQHRSSSDSSNNCSNSSSSRADTDDTVDSGLPASVLAEAGTVAAAAAQMSPANPRRRRRPTASIVEPITGVEAAPLQPPPQQQNKVEHQECWDLSAVLASTQDTPWSELQQDMQQLTRLRAAARPVGLSAEPRAPRGLTRFDLVNPQSTVMLLWACAKLKRLPRKKVLWQLLLLMLVELHEYTPQQLTGVMWSAAKLVTQYGKHMGPCRRVLKLLVVGAQWRLHTGLAGDDDAVQMKYVSALRFLAGVVGVQRLLQLSWRVECSPAL